MFLSCHNILTEIPFFLSLQVASFEVPKQPQSKKVQKQQIAAYGFLGLHNSYPMIKFIRI